MSVHPLGKLKTSIISSYRVDRLFYPGFPAKLIKKPRQVTVESDLHPLLLHMFGVALDAKPAAQGDSSDLDYTVEWDFTYKADLHRLLGRGFGYRLIINHNRRRFAVTQGGFGPKLELQVLGQADDTVVESLHMTGHFWNEVFDQVSGAIEFFRDVLDGHSVEVEVTADHIRVSRDWVLEISVDRFNKLLSPEQLAGLQRYSFLLGDLFTLEQFLQAPQQHRELGEVVRQEVEGLFYWLLESTPPADQHPNFEARLLHGLEILEACAQKIMRLHCSEEEILNLRREILSKLRRLAEVLESLLSCDLTQLGGIDWLFWTQVFADITKLGDQVTQETLGFDSHEDDQTDLVNQPESLPIWSSAAVCRIFDIYLKYRNTESDTPVTEELPNSETESPPLTEFLETENFTVEWSQDLIWVSKNQSPNTKKRRVAIPWGVKPVSGPINLTYCSCLDVCNCRPISLIPNSRWRCSTSLWVTCMADDIIVIRNQENPVSDYVMMDLMAWQTALEVQKATKNRRRPHSIVHRFQHRILAPTLLCRLAPREYYYHERPFYFGDFVADSVNSTGIISVILSDSKKREMLLVRSLYPDSQFVDLKWKTQVLVKMEKQKDGLASHLSVKPLIFSDSKECFCMAVTIFASADQVHTSTKEETGDLDDEQFPDAMTTPAFVINLNQESKPNLLLLSTFKFYPEAKCFNLQSAQRFDIDPELSKHIWIQKKGSTFSVLLSKSQYFSSFVRVLDPKSGQFTPVQGRSVMKPGVLRLSPIASVGAFWLHEEEKGDLHVVQQKYFEIQNSKLVFFFQNYTLNF